MLLEYFVFLSNIVKIYLIYYSENIPIFCTADILQIFSESTCVVIKY